MRYENANRDSSRLSSQEVFDLWRATKPSPVDISKNFILRKFTVALQNLKRGKDPGPDSIFTELKFHVGATLKS